MGPYLIPRDKVDLLVAMLIAIAATLGSLIVGLLGVSLVAQVVL